MDFSVFYDKALYLLLFKQLQHFGIGYAITHSAENIENQPDHEYQDREIDQNWKYTASFQ